MHYLCKSLMTKGKIHYITDVPYNLPPASWPHSFQQILSLSLILNTKSVHNVTRTHTYANTEKQVHEKCWNTLNQCPCSSVNTLQKSTASLLVQAEITPITHHWMPTTKLCGSHHLISQWKPVLWPRWKHEERYAGCILRWPFFLINRNMITFPFDVKYDTSEHKLQKADTAHPLS